MIELVVQDVSGFGEVPGHSAFSQWIQSVLADSGSVGLTIRVVDEAESKALNLQYRGKAYPTNVLAFPADLPPQVIDELETPPLGDIVICAGVVASEATNQNKPIRSHWAHLAVHGVLHLLGFDHQDDDQATVMESLEVRYLAELGFPNPYQA